MLKDAEFRDRWREANRGNLLTQSQIDALPVDTKVVILWSGGNGPWEYYIDEQDPGRHPMVRSANLTGFRLKDPVDFVGSERYHTQVVLAENEVTPDAEGAAEAD